mmetsp:Transcript_65837/g.208369  ORF Transcript_65837/g.208369 Transcript_65837/m.208369 type:complete len:212 (+) Transcript_65837:196-831(+)
MLSSCLGAWARGAAHGTTCGFSTSQPTHGRSSLRTRQRMSSTARVAPRRASATQRQFSGPACTCLAASMATSGTSTMSGSTRRTMPWGGGAGCGGRSPLPTARTTRSLGRGAGTQCTPPPGETRSSCLAATSATTYGGSTSPPACGPGSSTSRAARALRVSSALPWWWRWSPRVLYSPRSSGRRGLHRAMLPPPSHSCWGGGSTILKSPIM